MSDIVGPILEAVNAHPQLSGLVTFLISAGESVAILGTIVPGSITMTAIGALAGAGIIPLWQTIFWAILGAIVGDGISYWIGHHFKDRLPHVWPFRNHPSLLKTGELFFHKHGGMSVFVGRFVGPVRALVPLVAGMLGMPPLKFYIANIASAILWAPAYMLPGILVGAAALELPPDIAMHVIMVLIFVVLLTLLILWFIYKSFQLIQAQTEQLKNWIWQQLKASHYFSTITVLLKHHDPRKPYGQLGLALYFLAISSVLLCLAIYVRAKGPGSIVVNDAIFHFFRGIRSANLDNFMLDVTLLGQKQIVLPAVLIFFIYLLFDKRWWTALHTLALAALAGGAVYIMKHLIHTQRPWGIFQNPESYSMPSGHTTLATTVYVGFAFLLAASFAPNRRWIFFAPAYFIAFAVGISRLYLGAHWFTDVLSAWLLGIAVLIIVIISYRRREKKQINCISAILVGALSLAMTYSAYHYLYFPQLKIAYAQLSWPTANIALQEWWQKNNAIPSYRVSLFGFPSQKINIEWAGDIQSIEKSLRAAGWSDPPARDWVSTLHRVADISSTEYLPLISPQYLDKKPTIILTRRLTNGSKDKKLLVLRLWYANRIINETQMKLWVGVVSIVPRSYSWIFNHRPSEIDMTSTIIFPINSASGDWETNSIMMNQPTGTKKLIKQKILLIRPHQSIHKKSR